MGYSGVGSSAAGVWDGRFLLHSNRGQQSGVFLGGSSSCVSIRISRCSDLDFAVSIRNSGNTGGGFYELLCGAPIGPGFLFGPLLVGARFSLPPRSLDSALSLSPSIKNRGPPSLTLSLSLSRWVFLRVCVLC